MSRAPSLEKTPFVEDDDADYVTDEDDDPAEIELQDEDVDDVTLKPFRPEDETIGERIAALRDIVPPATRASVAEAYATVSAYALQAGQIAGRLAWVGMTTALLIGLPLALSIENEGMYIQQEKDYYAQTGGQQPLISGQPAQGAGSGQPQGIVPPGF